MVTRDKEVMVFHYDPKKKVFLVSLHLENEPGALGNLADLLAVRGMNILEGFFGGMSSEPKATVSFFVETETSGWTRAGSRSSSSRPCTPLTPR